MSVNCVLKHSPKLFANSKIIFSPGKKCRFICLPYEMSSPRPSGPASRVFYRVPRCLLGSDPDMDYPEYIRSELSTAFSLVHFLVPHAIVRSRMEGRPLREFVDCAAYRNASLLYSGTDSPIQDYIRSVRAVNLGWRHRLRDLGYCIG